MSRSTLALVVCASVLAFAGGTAEAQVSCSGLSAFASCTAYASGTSVVFNNTKYTAIAPIPSNRDCPPNSPYDPSSDNWWTNNGACSSTSTATATATRTNTATATRTATATATSATSTATATRTPTATTRGTATATSTATRTSTATATRTNTATATRTSTATATSGGTGNCAGVPAFASCTAYASGAKVVYNNTLYHSLAPIPSTRDCPPSSPFNPSSDNWWQNDGACTGGATATATAIPSGTRTATATATRTPTATATSGGGAPSASELLAKMQTCSAIGGTYATDSGGASNISICGASGAVWWKADMDIDCDGVTTTQCNTTTDPWYQNDTSLHTSTGQPFNAATTPYVVIPSISSRWSYSNSNIQLGAVVAVIYNGQVKYGVFADTGPVDIIGESSYAMAQGLGINPDPANGGSDGPVYYLVFKGSKAQPVESNADAVNQGQTLARQFINSN